MRARVVAAVLLVLTAGCGGDSRPAQSAEGFRARAAAICVELERQVAALDLGDPRDARTAGSLAERAFDRLAALEPPADLAEEAGKFDEALAELKQAERSVAAAQKQLDAALRESSNEAALDKALSNAERAQLERERALEDVRATADALGFRIAGGCVEPTAPDEGQELAFARQGDPEADGIFVIDADGGRERPVIAAGLSGDGFVDVEWSPDGKRLAYVTTSTFSTDKLWLADANGANRRVVWSGEHVATAAWSPDGSTLAFMGTGGLTILDLASGQTHILVRTDPPQSVDVAWSPDGRQLALGEFAGIAVIDAERPPLRVDELEGATVTGLADRDDNDPAWSPDGDWIAFSRSWYFRNDTPSLFLVRPDGTGLRRLTSGAFDQAPAWSPDGRRVAFVRYAKGSKLNQDSGEIYLIDIATGQLTRVTNNDVEDFAPTWR